MKKKAEKKPQAAAAPQVSYEQIKAELQGKNIKVSVPLLAAGYKIIDQDGKEHRLEKFSDLEEYYYQNK